MPRNKYGYPVPEPVKTARHKHKFAEGGIMGFFGKDETSAEKAARYVREADARAAKARLAPKPAPEAPAIDNSVEGKTKGIMNDARGYNARMKQAIDDTDEPVQTKRKGGIVKPRGVGVALRGHGKGKFK